MVHYILLKLRKDADVTLLYFHCRKVYADLEWELPFLHDAEVCRCATARDSNADISKARELLGYDPDYDFEKGIRLAIDWYKENL